VKYDSKPRSYWQRKRIKVLPLNGNVHGFLLREGEFTTIDVPGAIATSAYGINARGDIVGGFNIDASHAVGFLRTRGERDEHENSDQGPQREEF
jgi:uncharacterized membrane protein